MIFPSPKVHEKGKSNPRSLLYRTLNSIFSLGLNTNCRLFICKSCPTNQNFTLGAKVSVYFWSNRSFPTQLSVKEKDQIISPRSSTTLQIILGGASAQNWQQISKIKPRGFHQSENLQDQAKKSRRWNQIYFAEKCFCASQLPRGPFASSRWLIFIFFLFREHFPNEICCQWHTER